MKALLRPRLLAWLGQAELAEDAEDQAGFVRKVESTLAVILHDSDGAAREIVRRRALGELDERIFGPAAAMWLSVLFGIDPQAGTTALERGLTGLPVAAYGPATEIFGAFLGDRRPGQSILASGADVASGILLRLVTLAYRHVRPEDDHRHEGAYTPDARDNAQHARNVLLDAVLRTSGPAGWAAKHELVAMPAFAHMRDRILAVARKSAAKDADGQAASASASNAAGRFHPQPATICSSSWRTGSMTSTISCRRTPHRGPRRHARRGGATDHGRSRRFAPRLCPWARSQAAPRRNAGDGRPEPARNLRNTGRPSTTWMR